MCTHTVYSPQQEPYTYRPPEEAAAGGWGWRESPGPGPGRGQGRQQQGQQQGRQEVEPAAAATAAAVSHAAAEAAILRQLLEVASADPILSAIQQACPRSLNCTLARSLDT